MIGAKVIEIAKSLLYIRERTGNNDHPMIDKMFDYLGLPHHLSWCLAFCIWCWHSTINPIPFPKVARCSTFLETVKYNEFKYEVFDAEDIAWGTKKIQKGDILIFAHSKIAGKDNWNGHAALGISQNTPRSFNTIEGNTNGAGSREGNGVYLKVRTPKNGNLSLEGIVRSRRLPNGCE